MGGTLILPWGKHIKQRTKYLFAALSQHNIILSTQLKYDRIATDIQIQTLPDSAAQLPHAKAFSNHCYTDLLWRMTSHIAELEVELATGIMYKCLPYAKVEYYS